MTRSFRRSSRGIPFALGLACLGSLADAQVVTVQDQQKISERSGGFGGVLDPGGGSDSDDGSDQFGSSMTTLGDLDGDGIDELAVAAPCDNDGRIDQGALWILFMNPDGTVRSEQKISATAGGFDGVLGPYQYFADSLAGLGDLDGDGIGDLAVGGVEGALNMGEVWILFLNRDGTVRAHQRIGESTGGFGGDLDQADHLGCALASLGDLDGDGRGELAVGAINDDDGGTSYVSNVGAVWILFLNADGTVEREQKISATAGGFGGRIDPKGGFGCALAALGDLDGDGVAELAVGAQHDRYAYEPAGTLWILFLNRDGTVSAEQQIGEGLGGFASTLDGYDFFGGSLAALGDVDHDGVGDLAVGARGDDDGGLERGAVWILYLNRNGTVSAEQKISATSGGFVGQLDFQDYLGSSVAAVRSTRRGGLDLAVGAYKDDDGGRDQGAVWMLFLGPDTTPPGLVAPPLVTVSDAKGGLPGEFVSFTVAASDDVDPAPSVLCVPPSGSWFPRGTTLVTCTATDAAGNRTTRVFPVVVQQTPSPRIR